MIVPTILERWNQGSAVTYDIYSRLLKDRILFVGGFGGGEVSSGFAFVTMKDPGDRPRDPKTGHKLTQFELMGVVRQGTSAIPGARVAQRSIASAPLL